MKYKFFVTIFLALSVTALSVSSIHYHFFKAERLRLIELNLQQNSNLLKNTKLDLSRGEFSNRGKELIEKVIGDDKVNMIVGIYNENGNILYKNENADIFNLPDTISEKFVEWEDIETNEYFIKYFTSSDRDQKRIVRVGMVLNQSLIRWKYLNQRILIFVALLLIVVSVISFILTQALFRPVSLISKEIKLMASKIDAGDFNELRSWFSSRKEGRKFYRDEYYNLLSSLDLLAERISDNQHQMQKWAALMAHELKSPMTRLKNSVDGYLIRKDDKYLKSIEAELSILEAIVMDFLAWASLENDQSRPQLHAISMKKRLATLLQNCEQNNPGIDFDFKFNSVEDFKIFCNPLHFDQLVTNLISNSVKYAQENKIVIDVQSNELHIQDFGPGIAQTVLDNLGKPFNRYNAHRIEGHGLGLAWVKTICKKYDWDLNISNLCGTLAVIKFKDFHS